MTDIVDIGGQPVQPPVDYDVGMVQLLEWAIARVKNGTTIGVAIVEVIPERHLGPHEWGTECSYQGPRLSLMAGCMRMAHSIQIALDERQRQTGR